MGLDIAVFSSLVPVKIEDMDEDGDAVYIQLEHATKEENWAAWALMLEKKITLEEACKRCKQWYKLEDELMSFHAGSYGGFNEWRAWLTTLTGPNYTGFHPLLSHSDCDGYLTPAECTVLYQSFVAYAELAKLSSPSTHHWERYQDWMKACELASTHGGYIYFH